MNEINTVENRETFFLSILLAYKNFSKAFNLELLKSSGESRILFLCFTSSFILFLANLPYQIAILPSFANGNIIFYIGLLGFISVFFMPLFLYLLSGVLYLIFKCFDGRGSFYEVRLAVFWSINVAGPLLIMNGLLKGFFSESEKIIYVSLVLEIFVGWIFANMLAQAEHFRSRYPIFFTSSFFIFLPQLMNRI